MDPFNRIGFSPKAYDIASYRLLPSFYSARYGFRLNRSFLIQTESGWLFSKHSWHFWTSKHISLKTTRYLLLFPHIRVPLSHQRSCSQEMEVNTDPQVATVQTVRNHRVLSPKWDIRTHPSHRSFQKEGMELL